METTFSAPNGYAGFWKRGAAFFIDAVIIMFPQAFLGNIFGTAFVNRMSSVDPIQEYIGYTLWAQIIAFVVAWVYMAGMESSSFQASIGKLLLGIRVVGKDGGRISFARATGRFWGRILSVLVAGLGLLAIAVSKKKQALHDMMADCFVVNKEPTDSQIQYSRVQDLLKSPVIAAVILSSAALIAATMLKSQPSLPASLDSYSTKEKSSPDLGTIHVVHSQKGPIVMQQMLTGPNISQYGVDQYGPINISQIPIEVKTDKPISLKLTGQKATQFGTIDGPISVEIGGDLKNGLYNYNSSYFNLLGLGFQ